MDSQDACTAPATPELVDVRNHSQVQKKLSYKSLFLRLQVEFFFNHYKRNFSINIFIF